MKKAISILLLAAFFLFQAGRILLYFECRFSNSITTSSCDCAQVLANVKPGATNDAIPVNNHAGHRHLPEEFEMQFMVRMHSLLAPSVNTTSVYTDMISSDHCNDIFHPPLS